VLLTSRCASSPDGFGGGRTSAPFWRSSATSQARKRLSKRRWRWICPRQIYAFSWPPSGRRQLPKPIRSLEAKAANTATEPAARIETLFTLGRLADRTGAYAQAFEYVAQANALRRAIQAAAGFAYDREKLTNDIDRLIQTFDTAFFKRFGAPGDPSETPVFIVGMPRAGSSLFEQIAASHSRVRGAGECAFIGALAQVLGQTPKSWAPHNIKDAAARYLNQLYSKAGLADRIIDKMPDNVFHLGLIAPA